MCLVGRQLARTTFSTPRGTYVAARWRHGVVGAGGVSPLDRLQEVLGERRLRRVVAGRVAVEAVAAFRALGDAEGLEDAVVVERLCGHRPVTIE